jgi:heptaprenyl diphosphate synthase
LDEFRMTFRAVDMAQRTGTGVADLLADDLSRVERALLLEVDGQASLTEPVRHLFSGVPKLVRPSLTLMSAYAWADRLGPGNQRVIDAATALELVHVGTMCHDDVMDEAEARRARPSVNARWGNAMAVLTGDFLLASAAEIAARLGACEAGMIAATFRGLCTGQMIETRDLYNPSRTRESYFAAITGKTATLLSSACRMGALEAGANGVAVERAGQFGLHFGIAFQINDDILDWTSSPEVLGKPAAKDAAEGVYTLPLLCAMDRCAELRTLIDSGRVVDSLPRIRELVRISGGLAESARTARDHFRMAEQALAGATVHGGIEKALLDFACGMLGAVEAWKAA